MLFNSYFFICFFLPFSLAVFSILGRVGLAHGARLWLIVASLFFYGWWNPKFVSLLIVSICLNYFLGILIAKSRFSLKAKYLLTASVMANLGCLAYFKYANFFIDNYNHLFPGGLSLLQVTLPLGISFYTFTQIAFLVDVYRGIAVEFQFQNYFLFVTYFPHLIAGPILHHKEMMPQFADKRTYQVRADNLVIGLTFFCMGLFKKVLVADQLSPFAISSFSASDHGHISFLAAWAGAIAYTFQLYFDFSGYCDMAIGISRMFGVVLPFNFNSPYKAVSIIDFWRRWHMTLSRFLRDYVYFSMGGNRLGKVRRHANLLMTMFLGGLWHGANWTFVVWGVLHGILLVINHLWNDLCERWQVKTGLLTLPLRYGSVALTFVCVLVLWVFFRADSFSSAWNMLLGMSGASGIYLPTASTRFLEEPLRVLHVPGVVFTNNFLMEMNDVTVHSMLMGLFVVPAIILVFCCPNSQELVAKLERFKSGTSPWVTAGYVVWGIILGLVLCLCLALLSHKSEFLYFQF